jgi:hypothetical protein
MAPVPATFAFGLSLLLAAIVLVAAAVIGPQARKIADGRIADRARAIP